MGFKTDVQISQEANMLPISEIAKKIGLQEEEFEIYGRYKAKISCDILKNRKPKYENPKLILTTAITPTPAGEGKSTTTIGLGQALNKIGKECIIALREPSLGPCFGVKGGATGGGYAQVVPMEDINLHFTGDFHAISAANNLLSSALDNHIKHGNGLNIDGTRIVFKRVVDMNDRALRDCVIGLGGKANGNPREEGFMITVASEVMAILCLAEDLFDLKEKLGNIIVAYNYFGEPVRARDLKVHGAMAALLKDAVNPNLVQTLENTAAVIHGGPFANIAHGCNSIIATRVAMHMSEYVVTEAGFGADLGAEKFFDIKCRKAGLTPDCVVLVATVRALKMHGGVDKNSLKEPNSGALAKGAENLEKHIENMKKFKLPLVVAINRFPDDSEEELQTLKDICAKFGVKMALSEVWEKGGEGGIELANAVIEAIEKEENKFEFLYEDSLSIKAKIAKIAKEIYGATGVNYSEKAEGELERINRLGFANLPVCMAKTQNSISDNPKLLGRPKGFEMNVKEVKISAGAGFIVVLTGSIMTMPGLPKHPAAESIDIDANGKIIGLF